MAVAPHEAPLDSLDYALAMCDDNPMAERSPGLTRAFHAMLRAAEQAQVRIVLCGAFARNAYLRPRMTDDTDFLVRNVTELGRVLAAARRAFETPAEPELISRLRHRRTGAKVDLIVAEYPFELEAIEQARPVRVRGRAAWVVPPEHLAAMKVDAAADPNRPEDFGEVVRLLLAGVADAAKVEAIVRRDLAAAASTLEAILRAVERARATPPRPARGRSRLS